MKTLPLLGVISMLAVPLVTQAQTTVFNDTFISGSLSTLNGASTPGGTPSASTTSYDVASTKTGSCAITAGSPGFLREKLSSGTTAGYVELQALFASTPVQLVNVGDSINLTIVFTNSAGTLLAGGAKSVIDVGLYNSGGSAPLAGLLNTGGFSTNTTYATGGCTNWQGYAASINYSGQACTIYTRPVQSGTNGGNQDLVFSGAGTGLFNKPTGTQIGSSVTSAVTLTTGAKYTLSYTILLSAPNTVSITNNLYDANGNLLSNQGGTTGAANTYTNYANKYDGLAIGVANSGTSLNPTMDISRITITTNYYFSPTITGLNNQTVIAGTSPTLSPTVTGNPPPGLQWYVSTDGGVTSNSLSYATGSSLTLTNVQYSQNNYIYTLVAANTMGTNATSMTLSVIVTPSITGLSDQAANVGDTVTISPAVSGIPAPALQWLTNGVPVTDGTDANGSIIAGSTTGTLYVTNAQVADSGLYSLVASNSAGIVTNSMHLTVAPGSQAPVITGPTNITVIQGNNGTFNASATGVPVPTLQWLDQTQTPILGATNNTLTLTDVQYSQNGYSYFFVASNAAGTATNSATLTVIVPPAITSQPANLVVTNTQSASFTVVATGVPALAYQWNKNGVPISPAVNNTSTNATFAIASAAPSDMATYSCTITNQAGTTNTASVTLTVNSTMSAVAFAPTNGQTGVCYDTPLYVTFSQTPTVQHSGTIKIFNVTNSSTPVDTIDLSLSLTANATYAVNIQPYNIGGSVYTNFPVIITGTTAVIYPHHGLIKSNQTYYVTMDDGTFADSVGAYFAGISSSNVWQFTTKVAGPLNPTNLIVAADGSGDFLTVQGAVDSVPANNTTPTVINILNGFYWEAVDVLSKNNLDFRGQSRSGTFIGYPNNNWVNGNGAPWRSMFIVNGNDCTFENLTITNTTPSGGSQAEAMDVEGTRVTFYNMELDSYQDTFLVHSASKMVYFQDCLIQGQTDFNWGYGTVYYTNCTINCLLSGGHVTQPRSTAGTNGFGFINCRITQGYAGSATFDLGRTINTPTSPSEVLYYNCLMADVVTGYYSDAGTNMADYNCSNLTATAYKTLAYSTHSPSNDPFVIAIQSAATWLYGWQPQVAPNILTNPVSQSISGGGTATFTNSATGIGSPTYQWLKNGNPIAGQTNSSLTISNASANDAASYSVIVSNSAGVVTSSSASLTVGNTAPSLTPVSDQTVNVGVNVSVTNVATDPDVPAQTLTFTLLTGPSGASVDSGGGIFTWRPTVSDAGTSNPIQVVVTDNGTPNLSATNSFFVIVNPLTQPNASSSAYSGGQFTVTVSGQSGPDYAVQVSTNLASGGWATIFSTNSPAMPFTFTDPNAGTQSIQFYRIVTGPPLP
jgi:pectin methylesterase-like acyl-CoA thioesterase